MRIEDVPFLGFVSKVAGEFFSYINTNDAIGLREIGPDFVRLSDAKERQLYGVKLEVKNNSSVPLNIEKLRNAFQHDENADLNFFYVRKKHFHATYVLTFNKRIATSLSADFKTSLLNGNQIVGALFDIYLGNSHSLDTQSFTQKPMVNYEEAKNDELIDPLYVGFQEMIRDRVYDLEKEYEFYQVVRFDHRITVDFTAYKNVKFNGVLALNINLSRKAKLSKLRSQKSYASLFDQKQSKKLGEFIKEDEKYGFPYVIVNAYMISDDEDAATRIATELGLTVEKQTMFAGKIIAKTIALQRNVTYNSFVDTESCSALSSVFTRKLIDASAVLAKNAPVSLWGYDIYDALANFSFRHNKNPHCAIVAPSGSGKSHQLQKILSMLIRYDVKTNTSTRLKETYSRFFDVGLSADAFVNKLHNEYPNEVSRFEGDVDKLKMSILDFKTTPENPLPLNEELNMSIMLINIILETNRSTPLSIEESNEFKSMVSIMYRKKMRHTITIDKLRTLGYPDAAEKMLALGYDSFDNVWDVKEEEFENFKRPTLPDFIGELRNLVNSTTIIEDRKITIGSLLGKMNAIDSMRVFSYFNAIPIELKNFYYIDFEKIKRDETLFIPVFWYLIQSFLRMDVDDAIGYYNRGEQKPERHYIIEESHNFLKLKSFVAMFDTLSRELRKHRIFLFFVTQRIQDIPESILDNLATKILVYPGENEDKEATISGIRDHLHIKNTDMAEDIFKKMEPYMTMIISEQGTFATRFETNKEEIELFSMS